MEPQVTIIKKEVELCKESTEVFEALESIIKDIRAKKAVNEIAVGNLQKLMTAVEGFEMLDEEVKNEHFYETAGLGGARLTKALIQK